MPKPSLLWWQFKCVNYELLYIDVLRQSWHHSAVAENDPTLRKVPEKRCTRLSAQAEYSIHQDVHQDVKQRSPALTAVYLLNGTNSCFQVVGFKRCDYDRAGRGYAFLSKCWHGTGDTKPQTLKVAAFWG